VFLLIVTGGSLLLRPNPPGSGAPGSESVRVLPETPLSGGSGAL